MSYRPSRSLSVRRGNFELVLLLSMDKLASESALRNVRRFLLHCGYNRGNKKGKKSLALTEKNTLLRDLYVRHESFVHHHYNKNDISLHDPTDELDIQPKAKHKGKRYCFIGAIVDGGEENSIFIAYDKFVGAGRKQTKEYHGMFNHEYYLMWFKRLLDELAARNLQTTIIVIYNAAYHKCRPADTPAIRSRKVELQIACDRFGLDWTLSDLKSVLWAKQNQTVCGRDQTMAEAAGHEVYFSPPHHSNLQPIGVVWAIIKGNVGRQYQDDTTFQDVGQRLDAACANLTSHSIFGCIRKAEYDLLDLHRHVSIIDDDNYQEDNEVAGDGSDTSCPGTVDDQEADLRDRQCNTEPSHRWADAKTCCEYLVTQSLSNEINPRNLLRTGATLQRMQWTGTEVASSASGSLPYSVDELGEAVAKRLQQGSGGKFVVEPKSTKQLSMDGFVAQKTIPTARSGLQA
ncbi:hypothetical protein H257_09774 [Aphanomyces astaci]|uniref:Tc1-like transposase DDE domain-containing protein n=1 Tax=Aphanomyces astaci TaxID=112090 RepID=W4GB69_APHAT|nr:hypothetical protein H257_09774 [Aphanomyces astaci]ETV76309.1 hypothetical protein H257_09774 [Aphanomyces astaci]|eukprot:XP_009834434.1 hypothetical protein H257_09774 [Aphanomyces astaci]